jgi:hypothetical protein
VGSDPRRLDGLKPDEKLAAAAVERATGATARARDVDGRQGAYDVDLTYPDGHRAALEVTTHAGAGVRHRAALLRRNGSPWPNPGRWSWAIGLDDPADIPRLRAVYARAIIACEAHDVPDPELLPHDLLSGDTELAWLAHESASSLRASPSGAADARPARTVLVGPPARAGPLDGELAGLPDAVAALLAVPHVARRAAKVGAARDVEERHLYVGLGEGGLPEPLHLALTTLPVALPPDPPELPDVLSHVWLRTAWAGSPLVGWDRRRGWTAHAVGT